MGIFRKSPKGNPHLAYFYNILAESFIQMENEKLNDDVTTIKIWDYFDYQLETVINTGELAESDLSNMPALHARRTFNERFTYQFRFPSSHSAEVNSQIEALRNILDRHRSVAFLPDGSLLGGYRFGPMNVAHVMNYGQEIPGEFMSALKSFGMKVEEGDGSLAIVNSLTGVFVRILDETNNLPRMERISKRIVALKRIPLGVLLWYSAQPYGSHVG